MQVIVKASFFAIVLALTGCAALNFGWYKPGVSQQEFAQDKFACMNGAQMQVSTSNVNGTGSTYYGGGEQSRALRRPPIRLQGRESKSHFTGRGVHRAPLG